MSQDWWTVKGGPKGHGDGRPAGIWGLQGGVELGRRGKAGMWKRPFWTVMRFEVGGLDLPRDKTKGGIRREWASLQDGHRDMVS